jgi:hypothetical protein
MLPYLTIQAKLTLQHPKIVNPSLNRDMPSQNGQWLMRLLSILFGYVSQGDDWTMEH